MEIHRVGRLLRLVRRVGVLVVRCYICTSLDGVQLALDDKDAAIRDVRSIHCRIWGRRKETMGWGATELFANCRNQLRRPQTAP